MQRVLASKIYPGEYDGCKVTINKYNLDIHINISMCHLGYSHYHDQVNKINMLYLY